MSQREPEYNIASENENWPSQRAERIEMLRSCEHALPASALPREAREQHEQREEGAEQLELIVTPALRGRANRAQRACGLGRVRGQHVPSAGRKECAAARKLHEPQRLKRDRKLGKRLACKEAQRRGGGEMPIEPKGTSSQG
eukprot:6195591-Pleurochrysis_carterae.AAC.3